MLSRPVEPQPVKKIFPPLRRDERTASRMSFARPDSTNSRYFRTISSSASNSSLSAALTFARANVSAALKLLFDADDDIVRKYREFVESGRAKDIRLAVLSSLRKGGKIFFTGCGSTGRLSIQLVSIWRDFWQKQRARGLNSSPLAEEFENRAFSVMAGG